MRELDEARERSVQRQRKHFGEGGNDSSSRSSSEETMASSHDAVLEVSRARVINF